MRGRFIWTEKAAKEELNCVNLLKALLSVKHLADADVVALEPHLPALMPSMAALMTGTSGV